MIARRVFIVASASAIVFSRSASSQASRFSFAGSLEQGSLVIGKAEAGARVTVDGTPVHVSPAGDFAFGFTYDQTKPTEVVAHFADGEHETRVVSPVVRHYEVQRITGLPEKFVT